MFFQRLRQKMKGIIIVVCAAFVLTLLYVGGVSFFGPDPNAAQAVARVNGDVIDAFELQQAYLQTVNLYRQFGQNVSQLQRHPIEFNALQQLVDYRIMLQAARRDRVSVDEREINDTVDRIKQQYGDAYQDVLRANGMTERDLKNALREQLLVESIRDQRSAVTVSDEDLQREYEAALQEIETRHILIEPEMVDGERDWNGALLEAEELLARIRAGEDFAALAAQHSDDEGSREDGGALGWIDRSTPFVQEFLDAAFAVEVGAVSEPVRSAYGYHLIQVTDTRTKEEAPFDEVKETLRRQVESERGMQKFQEWLDEERAKARVEILDPKMRAYQLLINDRIDQAIAQYREAIALNPLDPYLYFHLGAALDEVGASDDALSAYLQAAETSGFDPELWYVLGEAYRERGLFEAAKEAYLKSSEYAPSNLGLHQVLADTFTEMGFEELAAEEQSKADEIFALLLEQERQRQEQLQAQQELMRQLEEALQQSEGTAPDQEVSGDQAQVDEPTADEDQAE